jgi:hypothetical protein
VALRPAISAALIGTGQCRASAWSATRLDADNQHYRRSRIDRPNRPKSKNVFYLAGAAGGGSVRAPSRSVGGPKAILRNRSTSLCRAPQALEAQQNRKHALKLAIEMNFVPAERLQPVQVQRLA